MFRILLYGLALLGVLQVFQSLMAAGFLIAVAMAGYFIFHWRSAWKS